MKKKSYASDFHPISFLPGLLIFFFALYIVMGGLKSTRGIIGDEGARSLTSQIQHAAVTCYSIENQYPRTLEHLIENYGVYIDTDMYIVHYEAISSNIMPDISVIRR